jgi:two-component system, OmpR family, response regulator
MRILFVAASHPESAWLYKALQESAHSLQRAEDVRDGAFLTTQELFDAIVVMALDASSYAALLETLPQFVTAGAGAAIIAVLERLQALRRTAASRAAHDLPPAAAAAPGEASGALSLDPLTHELVEGERRLVVTRREYLLLECLMRQFNAPVPREQLIRYAWPEKDDVDPSSVNLVVSRLRRKLAQYLPEVHIETVSRYGYQIGTGSH